MRGRRPILAVMDGAPETPAALFQCGLPAALEVMGERWSFLILRGAFNGITHFEQFQSMKDAPLKVCGCGKKGKVRRKIGGGAGLIFKGSGFYITDYKKKPAGKSESGDAKPAPKPAPQAKQEDEYLDEDDEN